MSIELLRTSVSHVQHTATPAMTLLEFVQTAKLGSNSNQQRSVGRYAQRGIIGRIKQAVQYAPISVAIVWMLAEIVQTVRVDTSLMAQTNSAGNHVGKNSSTRAKVAVKIALSTAQPAPKFKEFVGSVKMATS